MSTDTNATHVIQRIITKVNEENRKEIHGAIIKNFKNLIINPNGICVLKKFILANKSLVIKKEIFEEIKKDCFEIIRNPFGNYIIQFVIDEWQEIYCKDIFYFVMNNLKDLIVEKFSSKVIQKIVELIGKKN